MSNAEKNRKRLDVIDRLDNLDKAVTKLSKGYVKMTDYLLLQDKVDTMAQVIEALRRGMPHIDFGGRNG